MSWGRRLLRAAMGLRPGAAGAGKGAMTSRQRLLALLRGEPVDRCGVCAYGFDGFNRPQLSNDPGCAELVKLIDAETEVMLGWAPRTEGNIYLSASPDVSESEDRRMEQDHTVIRTTIHTPRGDLHSLCVRHEGVETTWKVEHLLKTDEDVERFLSMPYVRPRVDGDDFAEALARVGERGLVKLEIADPICHVADLFEFGEFTVRAWREPATIRRLLDAMAPRVYDWLDGVLALGVRGAVVRLCGPEYASEPYLSPGLFRELVIEYDLPIARKIHDAGCYLRLHSHGRLANILDAILDLEPELLEPVEGPPSGDITMAELARRVGRKCVLMGNLEPRDLELASGEQVEALVREIMKSAAGRSPLIVAPTDGPISFPLSPIYARNLRRWIETALEWGGSYDWN
jgi:hypothetical protein